MSTRRALAFSYLDRYASFIVALVTSMLIARLLTPAEIGVYSITMVMIGFMGPFRELGASQYLIQKKVLTTDVIRSIWAIQLFLGLALALIIFFARNIAASFYHNPEIGDIMAVLALNSLLIPFGALTMAWLTKQLRFDQLAIIRFGGSLTGSAGSIYFAWAGHGPISLAYGAFSSTLAMTLISFYFRPKHFPWMPGIKEITKVIGFGITMSGITLLNQAYIGAPELILGRLQGMYATGLFGRAQGLVNIFEKLVMDSVYVVLLPVFSKLGKESKVMGDHFVNGTTMITAIGWSTLCLIAIMAHPAINFLYGNQWNGAINMTRALCLSMCFMLSIILCPAILIVSDNKRALFWLTALNVILQSCSVLIGARMGFNAIGWGIAIASFALTAIWIYATHSIAPFSWMRLMMGLIRSFLVTIGAAILPLSTMLFFRDKPDYTFIPLSIGLIGMTIGFLASAKITNHPVWLEFSNILENILAIARKKFRNTPKDA